MKARQPCGGGAVEFDEVDAGSYTVDVEASLSGSLSGVGSAEVAVSEGETASCSVLMSRVYTAAQAAERISDNNGENWNIIVAGPIDDDGLSEIAGNLKDVLTDGCISLDLSRTTGLSSIGEDAFKNCSCLSSVFLPEGITSIGMNSFFGCSFLKNIIFPEGITEILNGAFQTCKALKSVVIPDSVTNLGNDVFRSCSALENIVLSKKMKSIGASAFYACYKLKSIEIPENVKTIYNEAFYNCEALETITIPVSVTQINTRAFSKCSALTTVNYGGTEAQWDVLNSSSTIESKLTNANASGVTIIFANGTTKKL